MAGGRRKREEAGTRRKKEEEEEEEEEEEVLILACVENSCAGDIQRALIPAALLLKVNGKVGGHIKLTLTPDSTLICRAMPLVDSYGSYGHQVIACGCVTEGGVSVGVHRLTPAHITPVETVEAASVDVAVTVGSVGDVLSYRKNKPGFNAFIRSLLALYAFTRNARIDAKRNPLAKLLGVTELDVRACEGVAEGQVGVVGAATRVEVVAVESEDRKRLSVKCRAELGGLDHVLGHLRRLIVEPWQRRKEFARSGVTYPSGILLVGPPGCGKTSLVRQLCAETGAALVATAAAEVVSPFEGEAERRWRGVVERAAGLSEEGPCVLFLDEVDALCRPRTEEASLREIRMTTQVLLTLDKCRERPNLTLIAATNRPFDLDPGLRRSGRLEMEILLSAPSEEDRQGILAVHCRSLLPPHCPCPDLPRLAALTPGLVGADLQALTAAAAMSLRDCEAPITPSDATAAFTRAAASLTPSLHKTLPFITTRPAPAAPPAGLPHTRRLLENILTQHLEYGWAYEALRMRRPRGVLLYGPRGCGKTRLAASLAASKGCTFLSATAAHLLSPYVGDSEKRIAALFHAARLAQPTVLFIDEIDGIFGTREGRGGSSVGVSLLNELLQALDGAEVSANSLQGASLLAHTNTRNSGQDGVLVLAATNQPSALDPALLRPGRFDRLVFVPLPDSEARLSILEAKTQGMVIVGRKKQQKEEEEEEEEVKEEEGILQELAQDTEGFTGAELENLVQKALVLALREGGGSREEGGKVVVGAEHLWAARRTLSPSLTANEMKAYLDFKRTVSGR
ncbi:uncharacterized protein LOC126987267 isoform X2 [Eriocheir sinensis]|nr:uncharacterized protein LOC126987267 isoform X2 [Eriocheir sinensis]